VKHLQSVGLSEEVAKAITESIAIGRDRDLSMITTKEDFFELKDSFNGLKEDFVRLESEVAIIKNDIGHIKEDIVGLNDKIDRKVSGLHDKIDRETTSIREDIAEIKVSIKEISQHKSVMLQWIIGLFIAQMTAIAGVAITILMKLHS